MFLLKTQVMRQMLDAGYQRVFSKTMQVIVVTLGYLPELDNRSFAEGTTHINSCT